MADHPPSPPLQPAQAVRDHPARPPKSTLDPVRKQELLAKLKASTTRQAAKPPIFKTPALPGASPARVQVTLDGVTTGTPAPAVRTIPLSTSNVYQKASPSNSPDKGSLAASILGSTKPAGQPVAGLAQPRRQSPQLTPNTVVQQVSEDKAIARDFGYHNPEEIDLHKRLNKHVNGYLKTTCGIKGGFKAYTETEAWKVGDCSSFPNREQEA